MAEAEHVNMAEIEDAKRVESGVAKVVGSEEGKVVETEDVKMMEDEDQEVVVEGKEKEWEKEEENDHMEEKDDINVENIVEEDEEEKGLKRPQSERKNDDENGDATDQKGGGTKADKLLSAPTVSSIDRPVRERRSVERFVEALEKEPVKKFLIEKGRGTPLKEIPNVAYKLAKKKPADLKFLHQTLFGRQGKAIDMKNHILQFSGFVWHGDEETQKTKIKEKLDKCLKDTLAYLCYLLDVHFSRATARKEELVAMLLDFLEAPHATTDVILSEKEQSIMIRKRKRVRGNAARISGGRSAKRSRKRTKTEDSIKTKGGSGPETEDEEKQEDDKNCVSDHSKGEENENECEEVSEDEDDEDFGKNKGERKKSSKRGGSAGIKKLKLMTNPIKSSSPTNMKNPTKISSSKASEGEESNLEDAKVFSRKKNVDALKKHSTSKADHKDKITGKKQVKRQARSKKEESGPSKEELRSTICKILTKVDFNIATFSDVLRELAMHYDMSLTPRKAAIKFIIQEEMTKLADEAEENEEKEEDEEEEAGGDEDENPKSTGKEVED